MEDQVILAENLKQAWRELHVEVQKQKKIKFEMFCTTFSQTYSLLSKHLADNCLDKKYIEMISEAFLFANIRDETLDVGCLAAFVLTERMLSCCAFGNAAKMVESSTIYSLEARREFLLDFNDVNESVSKLTKILEDMRWKKLHS